ncbi:hypothetical protein IVB16_27340 [Bradyrhizobium sp. 183]|uniref:hypothetical protein n=1 Tax=unclassified Bradyrhizobium TaxID=2631580 RepID=UPI001FFEA08E|nr:MULTISPECIES: hypothetical protein [unclassified Bradyrhizobium]UPJ78565.1 hypothetical protein IVB17_27340 [Bradyrhizobium sp. 184]UPJ86360.1 hypothetical protein IVB16_27340 [Bradyrhizobium sp. 183]
MATVDSFPTIRPDGGSQVALHPYRAFWRFSSIGAIDAAMSISADSICHDMGIEIVPTTVRPGDNQTCAGATIAAIFDQHGAGHLTLVLRTITESTGNERALKAPIIWAVSDLIAAQPAWADLGLRWIEAFDEVNLLALMRQTQPNRQAVQLRAAVCTLLFERLSGALGWPGKSAGKAAESRARAA